MGLRLLLPLLAFVMLLLPAWSLAQDIAFQAPRDPDDVTAVSVMQQFAQRIVPVYHERDPDAYLSNLTALQTVTGDYRSARDSNDQLRQRQQGKPIDEAVGRALLDGIYAHARQIEANERLPFAEAFNRAFRERVGLLDNVQAAALWTRLETPLGAYREPVRRAFDHWRTKGSLPLADAVALVRSWLAYESRRSFAVLLPALRAWDNRRRYVFDADVVIPVRRGVVVHASVVRPLSTTSAAKGRVPAVLRLTLDPAEDDAQRSATHGYVGVTAYVRGRKPDGTGDVRPFTTEGEDAEAVIEWIARQPWSDGRVAMVGEGYSGYTAWAAARRRPAALKAIATIAPMAPGIDFPMAGQIYRNDFVRWIQAHAMGAPARTPDDAAWRERELRWYQQGGAYREIDRALLGRHDELAQRWLSHPSHDRYWQRLLPSAKQYAQIDIPVLGIGGYFGASAGALYYHHEHRRHRPQADTTLLLGPYDAASVLRGTAPSLRGYTLDPVARVDLRELRYRWLDHVFHQAKKPALLQDRVNLQVMGADRWRHTPTLDAAGQPAIRLHLDAGERDGPHRLLPAPVRATGVAQLDVSLADRRDAAEPWPDALRAKEVPALNSLRFVSEPLSKDTEVHGSLRGEFDITPSRQDVDLSVVLYEQTAGGDYVQLFEPYDFRASYAGHRAQRRLLQAGVRQSLTFTTERVTARKLAAGSRLVLVVGIQKRPDRQINYGSGQDVNAETKAADAGGPLRIRWHPGSRVDIQTGP
jgi:putative CocE/NonD family hydrolase